MRSLQDEIRQVQGSLTCPICGRSFDLKDIRVRGFIQNLTIELSIVCERSHTPLILIVPLDYRRLAKLGPITELEVRFAHRRIDNLKKSIRELANKKTDT